MGYTPHMDKTRIATARNPLQGMNWIRREKRLAIYLRDGLACGWCGASVEDGAELTLDHLRPNSKGGSNHESNLVTCCRRCNSARGARTVRSFAERVAAETDRTPAEVERGVRNCARRRIDTGAAKRLIQRRGWAAAQTRGDAQ